MKREQLVHFPLAAHDDGPDALAGVVQLILKEGTNAKGAVTELLKKELSAY
jgi:hypothetical protein